MNTNTEDKLKYMEDSLGRAKMQKSELETVVTDTSIDEKISEIRERMRLDSEAAHRNAENKLAEREYENYYRKKLSRTASEAAERRIEKRSEAEIILREEREKEALLHLQEEKEELKSRVGETDELLALIRSKKSESEAKPAETISSDLFSTSSYNKQKAKADPLPDFDFEADIYQTVGAGMNFVPAYNYSGLIFDTEAPIDETYSPYHSPGFDINPVSSSEGGIFGLDIGAGRRGFERSSYEEEFLPKHEADTVPVFTEHAFFDGPEQRDISYDPPAEHTVRVSSFRANVYDDILTEHTEHNISRNTLERTDLYSEKEIERLSSQYKDSGSARYLPDHDEDIDLKDEFAFDSYEDLYHDILNDGFSNEKIHKKEKAKDDGFLSDYEKAAVAGAFSKNSLSRYKERNKQGRTSVKIDTDEDFGYLAYDNLLAEDAFNELAEDAQVSYSDLYGNDAFSAVKNTEKYQDYYDSVPTRHDEVEAYNDILSGDAYRKSLGKARKESSAAFPEDHGSMLRYSEYKEHELSADEYFEDTSTVYDDILSSSSHIGSDNERLYSKSVINDNDERLIREYEMALGMKMPNPKRYDIKEENYEDNFREEEIYSTAFENTDLSEPQEDYSRFTARSLAMFVSASEKRVREYKRELKKRSKKQSRFSSAEALELIVDKLNINKAIVEERAESLAAATAVSASACKRRFKKLLTESIAEYNVVVGEYEAETGYSLNYASRSIPADIIAGRSYRKLPVVNYIQEDEFGIDEASLHKMSRSEKKVFRKEQLRVAKESEREERRIRKMSSADSKKGMRSSANASDLSDVQRKIDRDLKMIEARFDSDKTELEKARDFTEFSFSVKYRDKKETLKNIDSEMHSLSKRKKLALKLEREDSERYYAALLIKPDSVVFKKKGKLDRLESLNMRIDALLSERERINEQLIKLYTGGTEKSLYGKANAKSVKIRKKTAKRIKRRFNRDMRVLEYKIPLDLKEKLVKCVNKIIAAESENADLRYRLKKQRLSNSAKRDIKRRIKDNRSSVKRYLGDYKHFLKKCRKYAERGDDMRVQFLWIVAAIFFVGVGIAVYFAVR